MKIAILTLVVGNDYRKAMEPGLQSKRDYASRHGYAFVQGDDSDWDRSRPISWSKLLFILKHLDNYDYIFWSDADVIILNQNLSLEMHIAPLLPVTKDLLWTHDACDHFNGGHMWIRGRSAWVRDFLTRVYAQTDLIYHIWWDNAALIRLYESNPKDAAMIETCRDHWLFNAYMFGKNNSAIGNVERMYQHGDFLIHFAGVYDMWNIYRMMKYMQRMKEMNNSPNLNMLDAWRKIPLMDKEAADKSLTY